MQSGSSVISRLWALSVLVASRLKHALLLSVQKTLGVVSTHYQVNLGEVAAGYVIAKDLSDDKTLAVVEQADAATANAAKAPSTFFQGDLFLDGDEDEGDVDGVPGGGEIP